MATIPAQRGRGQLKYRRAQFLALVGNQGPILMLLDKSRHTAWVSSPHHNIVVDEDHHQQLA